ncbi:hypothetical protein HOK51_00920 [Candidatus Woesearchaeota archaeon]|jgi:FlaG/FlaF family flagellin (archaellin)|nr:hypothetical protein [Candidatus Woesearchaeota archaeon]MBT6518377.1 hypothetical protein [Candidatus Woesearchaeota archaeon]MBT7368738.1 hypothetical protein [Candidatus Woesearchaeota archaeon]
MKFKNEKLKLIIKDKRGVGPWISWVLIMAFAVALSAFMYSFMVEYTSTSTDEIKEAVYNTDECRSVSLSIESVCQNTTTSELNIEIKNRNYRRIDLVDYRLYDASQKPISTNATNVSLNPNRKKTLNLSGVTSLQLGLVEIIPSVNKEEFTIICSDKKASSTTIVQSCS